jgi:hypothetical protein
MLLFREQQILAIRVYIARVCQVIDSEAAASNVLHKTPWLTALEIEPVMQQARMKLAKWSTEVSVTLALRECDVRLKQLSLMR